MRLFPVHFIPARGRRHGKRRATRNRIHPLREALAAGIAVFLVSCIGLALVYHFARRAQLDAVREELSALARTLAIQLDGDRHRTLTTAAQMGSPAHRQVLAPMVAFHRANPSLFYDLAAVLERAHRELPRAAG